MTVSLQAAYNAAEALLPDGWGIGIERNGGEYEVGAGRNEWEVWVKHQPTLADALKALTAELREWQEERE